MQGRVVDLNGPDPGRNPAQIGNVRTRQILLPDIDPLAEGSLGRYEQRALDRRDMLALALLPHDVVRALARGALARKRDAVPCTLVALGGHVPTVPA